MRRVGTGVFFLGLLLLTHPLVSAQDCQNALSCKPGVVPPRAIEGKLRSIAMGFCSAQQEAGRTPTGITITSGTRSTGDEAAELQKRLEKGDALAYYENQEAVKEIKEAYRQKQPLKQVLDAQVARGCYVSKHLFDHAVDIRNADMDAAAKEIFKAVATVEKALIIEDEGGTRDHFHLNFPPYPGDPKKCP